MTHLTAELAYWINERESIRAKRLQGLPAPWSADPIFQNVRFCNVHREDDTVTQWFRNYWNKPDDPAWKFVLGRMINLPESLEEIKALPLQTNNWHQLDIAKEVLKQCRTLGRKIFTSAYTISTCGQKMDKLDYVFGVVAAVKKMEDDGSTPSYDSLKDCAEDLACVKGLGTFLAGQVIADMKNTIGHPLNRAPDWATWSVPGPGSLRGLSWYFYGQPSGVTPVGYDRHIRACHEETMPLVDKQVAAIGMQDFQNSLCEFSKYTKVKMDPKAHVRNRVHYV